MNDIVAAFKEYFEIIDANSPELLQHVFRLRYQVLCIEQRAPGFETANYPMGLESDDYDRHSCHILLRHRLSGEYVGTARLILPDPLNPQKLFPTEMNTWIDPNLINVSTLSRRNTGEISRLFVIRRFKQRKGELLHAFEKGISDVGTPAPIKKRRRFPHPVLALAVGIIGMSVEHNITHWLSVMEPALNRLLGLYGLQLDPIGPITEHHGLRQPYYVDLSKMLDRMYESHNEFWELVTNFGRVTPIRQEQTLVPASNIHNWC